ncbi:hypothetical protein R1sor_007326 [Riccia sorocarpa]|uniref:Treslin n=1 Tax=Riccia sorocarpa TaxID=122646 RepID=A0ABD3HQ52_9MARC
MKQTTASLRRRRFERVVFLVDVNAVHAHEDSRNCAAQIFSAVVALLEKCNEQSKFSTLWGYVFFDSSRSPVASNAAVGRLCAGVPPRERFDGISENLEKFGKVLEATLTSGNEYTAAGKSRVDCVARTLATVASDFQWDPLIASDSSSSDEEMRSSCSSGIFCDLDLQFCRSEPNLVILITSLPHSTIELAGFLDFPVGPAGFVPEEELHHEFSSRIKTVQPLLDSKKIQCWWIDVPTKKSCSFEPYKTYLDFGAELSVAQRCLFDRGWNFTSLGLVANIESLIPFRLIWNSMAQVTPQLLENRDVACCDARVHCGISGAEHGDSMGLTVCFTVEVQQCGRGVTERSRFAHGSRNSSWLFAKEELDITGTSLRSRRLEIVISAKLPSNTTFQLTSERYIVLHKGIPSRPETESRRLASQSSRELKDTEPSWNSLLISLESEGFVALATVTGGHCKFQAILEPFTPNLALLTVLDNADSPAGRKHVPKRLSCHLSRVSKKSFKVTPHEYARGKGSLRNILDNSKIDGDDVNKFEKSFDSNLLKVVKEKRRGSVLFKPVKKRRVELGKRIDPTHELFRGRSSEPEHISWSEFWRRSVKRLKPEHTLPSRNFTFCCTGGDVTCSDDLTSLPPTVVHAAATGVPVSRWEPKAELLRVRADTECVTRPALENLPQISDISMPLTPAEVRGDSELRQTITVCPSHAASPLTSDSCSPGSGDCVAAGKGVRLLSNSEFTQSQRAASNKKGDLDALSPGNPSWNGLGDNGACELSLLEELVQEVVTSGETDLHQFAKSVVSKAYEMILQLNEEVIAQDGMFANEKPPITVQLKKLLLKRPKHLVSKYKGLLVSGASFTRSKTSILAEKFREHELQILFRLEILALEGNVQSNVTEGRFTRDICQLLDNIQFHFCDGEGNEQTLQQYCDRVIVPRYRCALPGVIEKIYLAMELNGYCDPTAGFSVFLLSVQTSESQLLSENVTFQFEDEPAEPSSYEEGDKPSQQELLPDRALSPSETKSSRGDGITSSPRNSAGKENWGANNAFVEIPQKLEAKRRKKAYHFSSGLHNLLRVKVIKPRDSVVAMPRKSLYGIRPSAATALNRNPEVLNTKVHSTPAARREDHVLQTRGTVVKVCQTPALKLGR